jgi:diaminohydroxyphosphoribosylaminopyrimidine deaminase / 5-amino-6-(5-phosphoribosylamino)uracil reductase
MGDPRPGSGLRAATPGPHEAGDPVLNAEDRALLERARQLGRRGWGQVHPNPMVGCVIARPGGGEAGGGVLGEGWHARWGGPHAEVNALAAARAAGHDPDGSTAYVSLEPCRHEGKTPPCTRALREAGVTRVVFGAGDPGAASGGGGDELRASGLEVVGPVFPPEEATRENPAFFHGFGPLAHRPWVVLKLALSADGFIAARPGERTAISGPEAGERVQRLRAGVDALLVGGRTARVDDPLLTVRGPVTPRIPPRRVVLDPGAMMPAGARLFREGDGEVIVVQGEGTATARVEPALPPHVRRERLPRAAPGGRFDLEAVLRRLRALEVRSVLCEGGGELAEALLRADLVDRLVLVRSERKVGPGGVLAFPGGWSVQASDWSAVHPPETLGSDQWWEADRRRHLPRIFP